MISEDKSGQGPIFVERKAYRRRRLLDAARALPALGAMLLLVPLLWGISSEQLNSARALTFVFAAWLLLICVSAILAKAIDRAELREAESEADK